MDFNTLGAGSPFYILRKGDKPVLEVGVLKNKSNARPQYQTQTPNVLNGMNFQQVVDLTVTVNGNDRVISGVPVNVEIAAMGSETFSGSREAMLQAVDQMLQTSKKALEQIGYHKTVIAEGEKMMEALNPQYAENKAQAKSILDLQARADAQDKKLDSIYELLQKMSGTQK